MDAATCLDRGAAHPPPTGSKIRPAGSIEHVTAGHSRSTSKWRCGPVEKPLEPSSPSTVPGAVADQHRL
jgi:hypothetical protein